MEIQLRNPFSIRNFVPIEVGVRECDFKEYPTATRRLVALSQGQARSLHTNSILTQSSDECDT